MFFLFLFLIHSNAIYQKLVISSDFKSYSKTMTHCCSIFDRISDLIIQKNDFSSSPRISIDPKFDQSRYIYDFLYKMNISSIISSIPHSIHIKKRDNSEEKCDFSGFEFLKNIKIRKGVFSSLYCLDSADFCSNRTHSISYMFSFLLLVVFAIFLSYRIDFSLVFSYQKSKKGIICSIGSNDEPHEPLNSDIFPSSKILKLCRDYPTASLLFSTSIPMSKGEFISFQWNELYYDYSDFIPKFSCEFSSKGDITIRSTSINQLSSREYRPIRLHSELGSLSNFVLELPFSVLSLSQPHGFIISLFENLQIDIVEKLSDQTKSLNPCSEIAKEYCKSLNIERCLLISPQHDCVFQYQKDGLVALSPASVMELSTFIEKLPSNLQYSGDILQTKHICFFNSSDNGKRIVIFAYNEEWSNDFLDRGLYFFALCISFLYEIGSIRDRLLRFERMNSIFDETQLNIYNEYDISSQSFEYVFPKQLDEDVIKEGIEMISNGIKHKIYNQNNGKFLSVLASIRDNGLLSIYVEDVSHVFREQEGIINRLKNYSNLISGLSVNRIIMKEEPHIIGNDTLITSLGYPLGTPLMSIVYPQDSVKFRKLGSSIILNTPPTKETFHAFAHRHIQQMGGKERRFIMPKQESDYLKKNNLKENWPKAPFSENMALRLIAKSGKILWYAAIANADIGFLFPINDGIKQTIERNKFMPLPMDDLSSILWGVSQVTDEVFSISCLPTIWEAFDFDQKLPFSYFLNLLDDNCQIELRKNIDVIKTGRMKSWASNIQLSINGALETFRFSISEYNLYFICVLTRNNEFSVIEKNLFSFRQSCDLLLKKGKLNIWRFYDNNYDFVSDNHMFAQNDSVSRLSWGFVDKYVDPSFKVVFNDKMRQSLDFGHIFEMFVPLIDDKKTNWVIMRGKSTEKSSIISGLSIQLINPQLISQFDIHYKSSNVLNEQSIIQVLDSVHLTMKTINLDNSNNEQIEAVKEVELIMQQLLKNNQKMNDD